MVELSSEMVVFEILTRVPPKVVGRSKSVCKAWYALLSGHTFVREHFSRSSISSNQKVLLIDDQTCRIQPINFETHNYDPGTIVPIPFDHRHMIIFSVTSLLFHIWTGYCVFVTILHPTCFFGIHSLPLSNACHPHIPPDSIEIILMLCTPTLMMISKSCI